MLTRFVQVTLKENANEEELTKAKENARSSGGEIKHEFTLIKGFTCVLHPALPFQPLVLI
jgi:hypothetical protein